MSSSDEGEFKEKGNSFMVCNISVKDDCHSVRIAGKDSIDAFRHLGTGTGSGNANDERRLNLNLRLVFV